MPNVLILANNNTYVYFLYKIVIKDLEMLKKQQQTGKFYIYIKIYKNMKKMVNLKISKYYEQDKFLLEESCIHSINEVI